MFRVKRLWELKHNLQFWSTSIGAYLGHKLHTLILLQKLLHWPFEMQCMGAILSGSGRLPGTLWYRNFYTLMKELMTFALPWVVVSSSISLGTIRASSLDALTMERTLGASWSFCRMKNNNYGGVVLRIPSPRLPHLLLQLSLSLSLSPSLPLSFSLALSLLLLPTLLSSAASN